MEIKQIHNITIDTDETIKSATLASPDELILLMSSGTVVKHTISEQKDEALFSVNSPFTHKDGGFDIEEQSTIYTLDSIIVVVNNFKRHGVVHYPDNYNSLRLWRGEYHVDISRFPIALYKNDEGIPHLIYGNDWNHIQIMNLDTRQILTAAKSLISDDAEERHIEGVKRYGEGNKLAWPSPYDYFYGRLEMSPNNQHFLCAGWVWGSFDGYSIYEVDDFITNPRITERVVGGWEHESRATCWIDNQTIAVAIDPRIEGDEDGTKDSPNQLYFYRMTEKEVELDRKADVAGLDLVRSEIHLHKESNSIVVVSDQVGVAVVSLDGEILLNDPEMDVDSYNSELNAFVKWDEKSVCVYALGE